MEKLRVAIWKTLKFAMSNSLFLALNGAVVVVLASSLYETVVSFKVLLAAFLVTFSVYSLNMVTDRKEDEINRADGSFNKTWCFLIPSVISMIISLLIASTIGALALTILAIPIVIGFLYSVQITKKLPRLKEVVGVKSVVVALSWAITGTFLPIATQPVFSIKEALVFLYIFAQILVNTIIFDVLDTKGDNFARIDTIPTALGKNKTKKLLLGINVSLVGWLAYCFLTGVFTNYLPFLAFGVFYEFMIIWYFFGKTRRKMYAELTVDGEWLPLLFLVKLYVR